MNIRLLSSQSRSSQADSGDGPAETATGHPPHLPEDLGTALREQGHHVEIDLLGDTLHGLRLASLREAATAGRKIAGRLDEGAESGCVLHALDAVAWAAALTARSLTDVSVVLRLAEPALAEGAAPALARTAVLEPALAGGTVGGRAPVPARGTARGTAPDQNPLPRTPLPTPAGATAFGSGRRGAGSLGSGRVSPIGSATEQRAFRACLRAADAVAATEDEDRLAALRAGVRGECALLVPDLVIGPDDESTPIVLQPGRHVLSLNGIGAGSGIGTLLAAMRRLPGADLIVAGPGSRAEVAHFRALLGEFALTDRVHWQGPVDHATAVRLIDAAALLVLPTPSAGASAAILGMSRARAVVTVEGGPAVDAVVDGITGAVPPSDRPDALAHTLHHLLGNPFRLEAMGLAGRDRALARYTRARAVSATEQAYRVALGTA